ncbi:hypothetical protein BaRGS_00024405 [Batillaria attramentaria]|uniref:Secreted protein n=1 Tax=Batillaria attramentaria TaxID=370345 RepID=A0ABD0KBL1_9CAEN
MLVVVGKKKALLVHCRWFWPTLRASWYGLAAISRVPSDLLDTQVLHARGLGTARAYFSVLLSSYKRNSSPVKTCSVVYIEESKQF